MDFGGMLSEPGTEGWSSQQRERGRTQL